MAKLTRTVLLMITVLYSLGKVTGDTGPEAVQVPQSTETIEGGTVIFTCTVNRPHLDIVWLIRSTRINNIVIYPAKVPGTVIIPPDFSPLSHGNYSAASDISGYLHSYTLHIANVTSNDGLFEIACAYYIADITQSPIGQFVSLRVWPRLLCSYSPSIIPTVLPNDGFPLTLNCTQIGLNPPLQLSWNSNSKFLSSGLTYFSSTEVLSLSPVDNGKEFTCQASHPSLMIPLTCSVTPYDVHPVAKLSFDLSKITYKDTIKMEFICKNIGAVTSDTYFQWYLDDTILENSVGVIISSTEKTSVLLVSGITVSGDTRITCEIVIPNVSASNATTQLELNPNSHEVPADDDDEETGITWMKALLAIVIPITTLLILILIGLCLFEKKCYSLRQHILYSDEKRPPHQYETKIERTLTPLPESEAYDTVNTDIEGQHNAGPTTNAIYVIAGVQGKTQAVSTNNPSYETIS